MREWWHSSTVLDGLSGQLHVSAALSREKKPNCPLNKRMCVFRTVLGSVEKREIVGPCRQLKGFEKGAYSVVITAI